MAKDSETKIYNAFNCPRGKWVDFNKKGEPRKSLPNAIVALRFILLDKEVELLYDNWKKHYVTMPNIANDPIRDWRNEIYLEYNVFFSMDMVRDAMYQISVKHRFNSQVEYYHNLDWDGISRIEAFAKECLHLNGTPLEVQVLKMQLVASVRRVLLPGTAYDLVPCLLSPQGYMKSKMLSILYGAHNVLAEDITTSSPKVQSEKTRNGINCVELPDTLGDNTRLGINKIKAFITGRFDIGRDAYGRVENIRPIGKTYVIWHTGNNYQFLSDETGNRRFIPMPLQDYVDENWLRANRDQIWAEAVRLEENGKLAYFEDVNKRGVVIAPNEEKFPDLFLPKEFWNEAEALQKRHMKAGIIVISNEELKRGIVAPSYDLRLKELINQPFVIKDGTVWVKINDVREYLNIREDRWIGKSREVTDILTTLGWEKRQVKRNDINWRGYVYIK